MWIGASAWCPFKHCQSDVEVADPVQLAKKYDKIDHNFLGVLQLVAKALEFWFGFIAANFVYNLTIILPAQQQGLPLGLLGTFLEFKDFVFLITPFRWTPPNEFRRKRSRHFSTTLRLGLFLAFAALLSMVTNLMGPATAVLVLPTLTWVNSPNITTQLYHNVAISDPPTANISLNPQPENPTCNSTELHDRKYSCTYQEYGASLDGLIESTIAAADQVGSSLFSFRYMSDAISYQGTSAFTFNTTSATSADDNQSGFQKT
ncbi:MAG: hypothetical protein LQ342_007902 [Letrouitia transgressa]|nr:MAG: hypothetical protein LQ342_007902 [Letrouitia transgressa]